MSPFTIIFDRHLISNDIITNAKVKSVSILTRCSSLQTGQCNKKYLVNNKNKLLVMINNHQPKLNFKKHSDSFTNEDFIYPTLIDYIINKYWQETIFLSKANNIAEKYINQLKSDGLYIYKNQYKSFLFQFSKALLAGRVDTYIDDHNDRLIDNKSIDVKYIWRKGFNFSLSRDIRNHFFYKNKAKFGTADYSKVLKILQKNRFPMFTVTNNLNQIIIAEPVDELISKKNIIDKLYQFYCNFVVLNYDTRPVYEGLFFINLEDAREYSKYVQHKYSTYNLYNEQEKLYILSNSLDFYYNLTKISNSRVRFRIIPDLKELGELIYKYQYYNNVSFHKDQHYGKDYFQGQPIYIIQAVSCKNRYSKKLEIVNYSYFLNNMNKDHKNNTIFMNYKIALLAWKKFINEHPYYVLPKKPQILVHNLEDFLSACEQNPSIHKESILLVPNRESYKFVKFCSNQINSNLSIYFMYLQVILKRLLWSLTTIQPVK